MSSSNGVGGKGGGAPAGACSVTDCVIESSRGGLPLQALDCAPLRPVGSQWGDLDLTALFV